MLTAAPDNRTPFQLKGSQFTMPILLLRNPDTNLIIAQLSTVIEKNINFFKSAPLVIDLQEINDQDPIIEFEAICQLLKQYGVIPVAVRNGNDQQLAAARAAGLGVLSESKVEITADPSSQEQQQIITTKLVTQPVRSGQQIYAKGSDLVVLSNVSAGAELLADGNIHVYGILRGRALAGVSGDTNARIFCHQLQAEMISIAGIYKLHDDLTHDPAQNHLQVYLNIEKELLVVAPISLPKD